MLRHVAAFKKEAALNLFRRPHCFPTKLFYYMPSVTRFHLFRIDLRMRAWICCWFGVALFSLLRVAISSGAMDISQGFYSIGYRHAFFSLAIFITLVNKIVLTEIQELKPSNPNMIRYSFPALLSLDLLLPLISDLYSKCPESIQTVATAKISTSQQLSCGP